MAENKTKPTESSVARYLAAIEDPVRRKDCETLRKVMAKASGEKAVMWGTAIVGFGTHYYKYESGREGSICRVGFSSRKGDTASTAPQPRRRKRNYWLRAASSPYAT